MPRGIGICSRHQYASTCEGVSGSQWRDRHGIVSMDSTSGLPGRLKDSKPMRYLHQMTLPLLLVAPVALFGVSVGCADAELSVYSDVPVEEEGGEAEGPNGAPQIVAVNATNGRVEPNGKCELQCEAVDPDGDGLAFTWSASQGDVLGSGPKVVWRAPEREALYRVSVLVEDGRGGASEGSVYVQVKANTVPVIHELSSDADRVLFEKSIFIRCDSTDPDTDEVSHEWEATGGEFFGHGANVIWVAPAQPGSYLITVRVSDGYGGEVQKTLPIVVTYREPPQLARPEVEAASQGLLKQVGDAWMVMKGNTCIVTCEVLNGHGPFTYEWTASQGHIASEGNEARWKAPDERMSVDITVRVTDAYGATSMASVLLYVATCTCDF